MENKIYCWNCQMIVDYTYKQVGLEKRKSCSECGVIIG